jgi:diaminohydroxyphosphoribosylaminopyrimidine deaminase / 5-amino-6-(5-phosphoribosylamino)uracil reductase
MHAASADDLHYMGAALALAARGLGDVAPNPAVGCVLVHDGRVVGRGWTQPGGRPHAETEALARAGENARGATAYVSLEPCAHYGKTPPCAEALIKAGVVRVVSACEDPDGRVAGRGHAMLRAAGIAVDVGVSADEAHRLNLGFFLTKLHARPMVTLKSATTLDGRIATRTRHSKWITGNEARRAAHLLRAEHDAIVVGVGTALADDPDLTCRLPGLEDRSPVRVVFDSRLRLPLTSRLVATARQVPTWVMTAPSHDRARAAVMVQAGVRVFPVATDAAGMPAVAAALKILAENGVTRLLAEGGSHLAASLLRAGVVDRLEWFRAAGVIGGDGVPALAGFGLDQVGDMPRFIRCGASRLGDDVWERYEAAREALF